MNDDDHVLVVIVADLPEIRIILGSIIYVSLDYAYQLINA